MQNEVPLVSIVTVVFNICKNGRANFLRQSIASVIAQDYPRIEHIIIDGASTDGTLNLLNGFEPVKSIKVFSESDTGIFNAMNKGLAKARGKYVAFLNSDDFYSDNRAISKVVAALERGHKDFTMAPCLLQHEDGHVSTSPLYVGRAFNVAPCYHISVFAKRVVLQKMGGFNESYRLAADSDLITRMLLDGRHPAIMSDSFATFRLGGASVDADACRAECERFSKECFCRYAGVSEDKAASMVWSEYVPRKVLLKFLFTGDLSVALRMLAYRLRGMSFFRRLFSALQSFKLRRNLI